LQGDVREIKNKFKEDIVEIHFSECLHDFSTILPSGFTVKSVQECTGHEKAQIQLPSMQLLMIY
jgi:hypothetical protein